MLAKQPRTGQAMGQRSGILLQVVPLRSKPYSHSAANGCTVVGMGNQAAYRRVVQCHGRLRTPCWRCCSTQQNEPLLQAAPCNLQLVKLGDALILERTHLHRQPCTRTAPSG